MKSITTTLILSVFLLSAFVMQAKPQNASFKTSAVCGMCEEKIMATLNAMDGVLKVKFDMTTKIVKVKFEDTKTSRDAIASAITKIGYDAGELKADPMAVKALPACCKPDSKCAD